MNGKLIWVVVSSMTLLAGCQQEADERMVGTLERNRIELSFESNEPVAEILVTDGQRVTAGTPLITQDASRMEIQLAKLEAERERAAARLAELERGPREESIREARALLESAQAETRNARAELERIQGVFEKGLSTRERLDRAETRYSTARSQEDARRESLDALLHGTTTEELQQAAAAVKSASASVNEAELAIERTRLLAPVDGMVEKVLARLGERPVPGQAQVIFLDDARTYARVYVPEYLKSRITPGARLAVSIDGQPASFNGTVAWISADASFTPYFALTEHDRSRLSYVAEIDIPGASELPAGVPLVVTPPAGQ
jgi:HlyD family secretion protein